MASAVGPSGAPNGSRRPNGKAQGPNGSSGNDFVVSRNEARFDFLSSYDDDPSALFPDENRAPPSRASDRGRNNEPTHGHDDAGSSRVASPASLTSAAAPPWWSQAAEGAAGPGLGYDAAGVLARNGSAESVVPAGGITMRDNEAEDALDGRVSACWARSVQIRDYVIVNGSATNIGAFVVWNIRVETLTVGFPVSLARAG